MTDKKYEKAFKELEKCRKVSNLIYDFILEKLNDDESKTYRLLKVAGDNVDQISIYKPCEYSYDFKDVTDEMYEDGSSKNPYIVYIKVSKCRQDHLGNDIEMSRTVGMIKRQWKKLLEVFKEYDSVKMMLKRDLYHPKV